MQQQPSYIPGGGQQPQYMPGAGQQPVVNNYYQQQPKSSGIGSGLQTAAIAGIGGLALYGALRPNEEKTVIIHDGGQAAAAPATIPASPPGAAPAPIAPAVQPAIVQPAVPVAQPVVPVVQPSVIPSIPDATTQPQAIPPYYQSSVVPNTSGVYVTPVPSSEGAPNVPLAPLPVPLAPLPDQSTAVPLAPLSDQTTSIPLAPLPEQNATVIAETTTLRLPLPGVGTGTLVVPTATRQDAAHAPLKGVASNFIVFSMSFYTCVAIALAKLI